RFAWFAGALPRTGTARAKLPTRAAPIPASERHAGRGAPRLRLGPAASAEAVPWVFQFSCLFFSERPALRLVQLDPHLLYGFSHPAADGLLGAPIAHPDFSARLTDQEARH